MTLEVIDNIKDIKSEQAVKVRYSASKNTLGAFNLEIDSTAEMLSKDSIENPDGCFYFICVGYDNKGARKLIADRNIQNNISWETLNTAGLATTNGINIDLDGKSDDDDNNTYILRLISTSVQNNFNIASSEWDTLFSSDNIDKGYYNDDNIASWTLNTPVEGMDKRIVRSISDTAETTFNSYVSSYIGSEVGFRPLLLIQPATKDTIFVPKCDLEIVRSLKKAVPGQAVAFEYKVTDENKVGTFDNIGYAEKADIPYYAENQPDGTAYFVCVGYEPSGALKFVADRNIQNKISWETLNEAGYCTTSGVDVSELTKIKGSYMRLMQSDVVNSDMDKKSSEYQAIIANDKIGATDISTNKINNWNADNTHFWLMNTPSQNDDFNDAHDMSDRVISGSEYKYPELSCRKFVKSDTLNNNLGFRPVLIVPINSGNDSIIPKCDLEIVNNVYNSKAGQAVACEYKATTEGEIGNFSALGTAQKELIADNPTALADGTFYFVNVGYTPSGDLKFVADRNIQAKISWEKLNEAGYCTTSGVDVSNLTGIDGSYMRLLQSNVSNSKQDKSSSEWDAIIFNDKIGATDISSNKINNWNYSNNRSWTLNTPAMVDDNGNSADMAARIIRGSEPSDYTAICSRITNSTISSSAIGFRPVLIVPINSQNIILKTTITPTHTYKQAVVFSHTFDFISEDANFSNTHFEYRINDRDAFADDETLNLVYPDSYSFTKTILYDNFDSGKNIVSVIAVCAGKKKTYKFTVIKEIAGDSSRNRDFLDYAGGFNLNSLSVANNNISGAKFNNNYNSSTVKLPKNVVSITIKEG